MNYLLRNRIINPCDGVGVCYHHSFDSRKMLLCFVEDFQGRTFGVFPFDQNNIYLFVESDGGFDGCLIPSGDHFNIPTRDLLDVFEKGVRLKIKEKAFSSVCHGTDLSMQQTESIRRSIRLSSRMLLTVLISNPNRSSLSNFVIIFTKRGAVHLVL